MLLKIVTTPNPKLHEKTKPVEVADLSSKKVRKLIRDMCETMRVKDGVGLAAPQIGSDLAICVIHAEYADKNKKDDLILINPVFTADGKKTEKDYEGCLSVPGLFANVERFKNIRVKAMDTEGKPLDFKADDYFARIIQHETDHLNGILMIDQTDDIRQADVL